MRHPSSARLDRFPLRIYLGAAGLLALSAAALLLATYLRGIPLVRMLRDPASYYDYSPFSGMISYGGILLMTAATAISGFAAATGLRWRGVLAGVAAFSGYFVLDDLFMLHEGVWPRLGVPEEVIMTLFAVGGLAILLAVRAQAGPERTWGLYVALGLMVGSILIDMSLQSDPATVVEDLLKFTAIGVWALFWTGVASGAVAAEAEAEAAMPAPAKVIKLEGAKWR
ncbi:hypothetical protein KTN05_14235 [Paracoccus sp. Z118]|uniref:hypothetical protein n=1 Tax=Paracoccus sp. Z118 TaxID=2851017 RepID=UPI001C2C6966|nr:hypothetical protein [Paracoccus sp. Z118]MBV0892994.1 hypothetical protein [Paracoccus sp. Z118]